MGNSCAVDQLIGSVKLGARAVSRKTPIYFMMIYLQLAVTQLRLRHLPNVLLRESGRCFVVVKDHEIHMLLYVYILHEQYHI